MSEKEFREKYASLKLDSHKWKFMPIMAMRENWVVLVSIIKEIDLDALYYYYKTNMYKVDLNQQHHFWADNLREKIRKCIENKEDVIVSVGPIGQAISSPIRYNPGGKGQALIELRIFGDFVFADSDIEELEEGVDKSSTLIEETKESVEYLEKLAPVLDERDLQTFPSEPIDQSPFNYSVSKVMSEIDAFKKRKDWERVDKQVFTGKVRHGEDIDAFLKKLEHQPIITEENLYELSAMLLCDVWKY
jgi:hypothetical protein